MKKGKYLIFLLIFLFLFSAIIYPISSAAATFGDIDGDGDITASDARILLRISAELELPEKQTDEWGVFGDIDCDGFITAADARIILRASAELVILVTPDPVSSTIESSINRTTKSVNTKTSETSEEEEDTTAKNGFTKSDIIAKYNECVNAFKLYDKIVTVEQNAEYSFKLDEFLDLNIITLKLLSMTKEEYNEMFSTHTQKSSRSATYMDGENMDPMHANEKLGDYFPLPDKEYMSALAAKGARKATVDVADDGSMTIGITLIQEKGTPLSYYPTHHASCVGTIPNLLVQELKKFDDLFTNPGIVYNGAAIKAQIDPEGRLTYLKITNPIDIKDSLMGFDLVIHQTMVDEYTLEYIS